MFRPILASYDFNDEANSGWNFETPDAEIVKALQEWNEKGCEDSDFPSGETVNA